MPLPLTDGWLIDFRTAKGIFASGSNLRIEHCTARCIDGTMHISHTEADWFKNEPGLAGPFMFDQCRMVDPSEEIFQLCEAIVANGCPKQFLKGGGTEIFLTAIAAIHGFGVISDCRPTRFATVYDLCPARGVPLLSADEYFAMV